MVEGSGRAFARAVGSEAHEQRVIDERELSAPRGALDRRPVLGRDAVDGAPALDALVRLAGGAGEFSRASPAID